MKIADEYFNLCRKIAVHEPELMNARVRYSVFARENGILSGVNKAVNFIKDQTYGSVLVRAKKDGDFFDRGEPVLVYEMNYYEVVTLETTILGFLSYSGAASKMLKIVQAAEGTPVIDMSARHYPWQIIEETALAAYLGGAAGTSTEAGYKYVQKWCNSGDKFRLYASLPHAHAAVCAQFEDDSRLFPSVIAAKMFHKHFPDRPVTVLADYEGKELDVAKQAFEVFGDKLFAVRLDTHGGRKMQGVPGDVRQELALHQKNHPDLYGRGYSMEEYMNNSYYFHDYKYILGNGVTVTATRRMRKTLDEIGAQNVKIVVSSGFNEAKIKVFKRLKAPMDFIGTGSWVDFMMFTADITHVFENGKWINRLKVGRGHGSSEGLPIVYERK